MCTNIILVTYTAAAKPSITDIRGREILSSSSEVRNRIGTGNEEKCEKMKVLSVKFV